MLVQTSDSLFEETFFHVDKADIFVIQKLKFELHCIVFLNKHLKLVDIYG
jgi:hypothetical protein